MSKFGIVFKDKSNYYGTMSHSLASIGYDILDFNDNMMDYDYLIVFYNLLPPKLHTNAKIGWYMNDLRLPTEIRNVKDELNHNFDFIFVCNTHVLKKYEQFYKKPTFYMPQMGIDTPKVFSKNVRPINWNVLFIGGSDNEMYHSFRKPFLESLYNKKLQQINRERYSSDQYVLYRDTKINLSMTLELELTTSNRLFNIISSGGFCLVKWFPKIELLFENKKHLVWFKTVEQMNAYIDYYLSHEKKRKEIAQNGYELYKQKHTALCRVENMFDIMLGKESKFRGFL